MKLAFRGYADGRLLFEEFSEIPNDHLDQVLPSLAERHGAALASHDLHMIEIEFLDEPNVPDRFFRFGTDPRGMVIPIEVDL